MPEDLRRVATVADGHVGQLLARIEDLRRSGDWFDRSTTSEHRLHLDGLLDEVVELVEALHVLDDWVGSVGEAIERAGIGDLGGGRIEAPPLALVPAAPVHRSDRVSFEGLPVDDRDRLLRGYLRTHLATLPPVGPGSDADEHDKRAVLRALADGSLTTTPAGAPVRLLAVGGGNDPLVQVQVGAPEEADATLIWVPGTGHGAEDLQLELGYADRLRRTARRHQGELAVVVDLYDGPDAIITGPQPAAAAHLGRDHAPALRALAADLRRRTPGPVTAVGHSYGTFAVGTAAADGVLDVDDAILLAPPGADVRHADQLQLADGAGVWAVTAPLDQIRVAADIDHLVGLPGTTAIGLGPDPTDREFGADVFTVNAPDTPADQLVVGHSQEGYLARESSALENIARIALDLEPTRPSLADVERRQQVLAELDAPWWQRLALGPGTDVTRVPLPVIRAHP